MDERSGRGSVVLARSLGSDERDTRVLHTSTSNAGYCRCLRAFARALPCLASFFAASRAARRHGRLPSLPRPWPPPRAPALPTVRVAAVAAAAAAESALPDARLLAFFCTLALGAPAPAPAAGGGGCGLRGCQLPQTPSGRGLLPRSHPAPITHGSSAESSESEPAAWSWPPSACWLPSAKLCCASCCAFRRRAARRSHGRRRSVTETGVPPARHSTSYAARLAASERTLLACATLLKASPAPSAWFLSGCVSRARRKYDCCTAAGPAELSTPSVR